jgi:xylulokinase
LGAGKYLLGFDIGSSSVKACLLDAETGRPAASASSPRTELAIQASRPGWAEQDPAVWWEHVRLSLAEIRAAAPGQVAAVAAIGISYQMHGLVLIDKAGKVLRPSIIWCDSRAVPFGEAAFKALGSEVCLGRLLNSPGNFTAAKLAWVKQEEPGIYKRVWKMLLPGDWIAFRMTGRAATTPSGLSEGILWDTREEGPARFLLEHFGFDEALLPELVPTFAEQGRLGAAAAAELGLPAGIPVAYRAGDQPNNAFSLNVLEPGELAATAGTSGVVYGIVDRPVHDPASRVNTFVHVNHAADKKRYGVLLCLNGAGSLNRWLRDLAGELSYSDMNGLAAAVPPGAAGLFILPYGNGAERTLGNRDPGASLTGLNFNIHGRGHAFRAAQEGIVFAMQHGLEIMKGMGLRIETVKAGRANMFLSPLFAQVFATVTGARVELFETDGSEGAARGAGLGAGLFKDAREAFRGLEVRQSVEPESRLASAYADLYGGWKQRLAAVLAGP